MVTSRLAETYNIDQTCRRCTDQIFGPCATHADRPRAMSNERPCRHCGKTKIFHLLGGKRCEDASGQRYTPVDTEEPRHE